MSDEYFSQLDIMDSDQRTILIKQIVEILSKARNFEVTDELNEYLSKIKFYFDLNDFISHVQNEFTVSRFSMALVGVGGAVAFTYEPRPALYIKQNTNPSVLAHELQHHIDYFLKVNGFQKNHDSTSVIRKFTLSALISIIPTIGGFILHLQEMSAPNYFVGITFIAFILTVNYGKDYLSSEKEKSARLSEKIISSHVRKRNL